MAMGRMKFILFSQQLTSELSPDRSAGLFRVAQFMCAYKYAQAQPLILIFTVCVCVCNAVSMELYPANDKSRLLLPSRF